MPSRVKKEDLESKSFSIYKKTWILLKDLEHLYIQNGEPNKPLKLIAHDAIKEYTKKEKQRREK